MSEPVATAPVVPTPKRNRVGIAALVLVLIAIAVPVLVFIVTTIAASIEGAEGDAVGWNIIGGVVIAGISVTVVSPIAIVGVVLGIIAVARKGYRKLQGVLAIVLGAAPALAIFGLPAGIDSLF